MNYFITLGKNAKQNEAGQIIQVPQVLKAFTSKWEREVGETINYEGERWLVMATEFDTKQEAQNWVTETANLYVQKNYWNASTKIKANF